MAIFKCKICGGTLKIDSTQSVAICEYCGTKQTLPKLDDERRANLYDRANHFRRNNDFDKAMGIYENILNEDNTDAEAYWSIVLCRYGIEYVEDPAMHKRVPTVNRAQFTSVFDDEDYKSALQYADGYQREIYESEATAINEIQKGILAISQKEEPFDVFICYKETDTSGRRTQDSVIAAELYHELTREGYKVFFSRITLEDKLGIAYEPYIFAALNSAKVMVVVGTRPEHFNAVWVKNEWSRFLALIKNGAKKTLIPAYRDMDPYDLPEEFSHLQAQDMSKLGFMQDLIRGIRKIIEFDKPKAKIIKATVITGSSVAIEPLFKRADMALADGEFGSADAFYEQILNQDPENAEAYVGKLLAEFQIKTKGSLKNCEVSFEHSKNYKKAIQFANEELKNKLSGALQTVLARIDNKKKNDIYQRAKILLNGARDIPSCKNAQKLFLSISGYLDAEQCVASCQEKINDFQKEWEQLRLEQRKKEEERRIVAKKTKKGICIAVSGICLLSVLIMSFVFYYRVIIPNRKYNEAINLLEQEKFQDAIVAFESLEGYKDSQSKIDDCKNALLDIEYNKALELLNQKKYQDAISAFESLNGYKDSQSKIDDCKNAMLDIEYKKALKLMNQEKYQEAIKAFETIIEYKDSKEQIKKCNIAMVNIGDIYTFGNYHGATEWIVLDKVGSKILVISKECLGFQYYSWNGTWEGSGMRKWLNNEFIKEAFNTSEQQRIVSTKLSNPATQLDGYMVGGGNDTVDKVFFLSIEEAEQYFSSNAARASLDIYTNRYGEKKAIWWLRSSGDSFYTVTCVDTEGKIDKYGHWAADELYQNGIETIRPALWIDLSI